MSSNKYGKNRDFQKLATGIKQVIVDNNGIHSSIKDRDLHQKKQVEKLYKLEKSFRKRILYYQQALKLYQDFIDFIKNEKGNILTAQPYFRESGQVFRKKISNAIKKEDVKKLSKFDINAMMVSFIRDNWEGNFPSKIEDIYLELMDVRRQLIENNLPLAINEAKKFYRKTPKGRLTLLDFIDISTYGLVTGIDKFVGKYTTGWRGVCIGRMTGFMIEEYNKTFIRMYPSDKKILYRANALKYRMKIENMPELVKAVNESFAEDKKNGKASPKDQVTEHQLITLMNSSHYWSADTKPPTTVKTLPEHQNEHMLQTIYELEPTDIPDPEESLIQKDLLGKIMIASRDLNVLEKKVIRLKGVDI